LAAPTTGLGGLRPGTVQFTVREGVGIKNLHLVLDRLVRLHGCIACGLNGIDLRFRVQDSMLFEKFRDIGEVQDVMILR